MTKGYKDLHETVIAKGLCTVCGTCAGVCPLDSITIEYEAEEPVPKLEGECNLCGICCRVCPGKDVPITQMERLTFGKDRKQTPANHNMGIVQYQVSAYANNEDFRRAGASGGVVSALMAFALRIGLIDCAVVARFNDEKPWRAEGALAVNEEDILKAAQSKYTVAPVNSVLGKALKEGYTRIGLVGLPCHIEAVRKIQLYKQPLKLANCIKLAIGLFCASEFYFEGTWHLLSEYCGIKNLDEVKKIQYRAEPWPGHFTVELDNGNIHRVDRHNYVYHFLLPMYKRDRCEMCIDWASELADIAVGDYWHPHMTPGKELGQSTCIIRSEAGRELIETARDMCVITTKELDIKTVIAGIGYEFKKHSAAFRLEQRQKHGWPAPDFHICTDRTPVTREFHIAPETRQDKKK